jgi:glycerophosphoryl diester phosphodiesterase
MVKNISFLSIILVGFFCITCNKPDIGKTRSLHFGKILVFGHGGSGFGIINTPNPANSTESIIEAINFHGADGVEMDVQILKDSIIVVYHDVDFNSQTNLSGCVQQKTADEVKKCTYRKEFISTSKGSVPAFLEDIITHLSTYPNKPHLSINVHLHYDCLAYEFWDPYDKAFAKALVNSIKKHQAQSWVWVESEVPQFLNKIQHLDSSIWLYYIADVTENAINTCVKNNFKGIVASHHKTSKADVLKARTEGLYISLYNANIRKDIKAAINKLPDFIQTDNIILTKQYLRE